MFPTLSPDSLQLYQYEFTRYPSVQSYQDFLEKRFGNAGPGRWNLLESGSVRILVN
jgi:hypothetical protein